jgi:hypothetical protein
MDQNFDQVRGEVPPYVPTNNLENKIAVFLATCPVGGKQIDHVDAILVSLQEIKVIICVFIWLTLEKRATTNGFALSVHLTRFS